MSFFNKIKNADLRDFFAELHGNPDEIADGTILANRLVMYDGSGDTVAATLGAINVVGVNPGTGKVATEAMEIVSAGVVELYAASPVKAGEKLKVGYAGTVIPAITASNAGGTIKAGVGVAFTNQPANDGVEIVSSAVGDTTQTITIIGTTTGTDTVVAEDVALNGTTQVATVKVNWGAILAVKLSAACTGTITVREASGNATIVQLAPAALSAGVLTITAASQPAYGLAPTVVADAGTTQQVGVKYTNTSGSSAYMGDTLAGAVAQTMPTAAISVQELYVGDLEAARTVTLAASATQDDELAVVGKALQTRTSVGLVKAVLSL